MSDDEQPGVDLAMQVRCLHCLREQYASAVLDVSRGVAGCTWCGRTSAPMTHRSYFQALTAKQAQR